MCDPEVAEVPSKGCLKTIPPLPRARKEAEITGRLLSDQPLIGEQATAQAVLEEIKGSLTH